jgi:hypothetical protein
MCVSSVVCPVLAGTTEERVAVGAKPILPAPAETVVVEVDNAATQL